MGCHGVLAASNRSSLIWLARQAGILRLNLRRQTDEGRNVENH